MLGPEYIDFFYLRRYLHPHYTHTHTFHQSVTQPENKTAVVHETSDLSAWGGHTTHSFFPNQAVPVYSSPVVALMWFCIQKHRWNSLFLETLALKLPSNLHPETRLLGFFHQLCLSSRIPQSIVRAFVKNRGINRWTFWNTAKNSKCPWMCHWKFLSFIWRYWGNIHAYRVLLCFCVCQCVFEVISSLACFHT